MSFDMKFSLASVGHVLDRPNSPELIPGKFSALLKGMDISTRDNGRLSILCGYELRDGENTGKTVSHHLWLTTNAQSHTTEALQKIAPGASDVNELAAIMPTLLGILVTLEVRKESGYTNVYLLHATHPPLSLWSSCRIRLHTLLAKR